MNRLEAESVCDYLRNKEVQLSSNNTWLNSCINWYKSHSELGNLYGSLEEYVCIQWLLADLRDVRGSCLLPNCKDTITELTGKYPVQINFIRDISQSCYTQMRTEDVKESESNENVSADEPIKQNWMPNPKRVLMMEVTDGVTVLKAMEYSPIENLTEPFIPGMKAVLIGPIECRKGVLFLKRNNISLLGGEVDHLFEVNSKVNLLSRCLNLPTNDDTQRDRNRNNTGTRPPCQPTPPSDLPPPLAHRTGPRVPCNGQKNEEIVISDEDDAFLHRMPNEGDSFLGHISDEDDAFLCQLPDEVLEYADNNVSPVLDRRPAINGPVARPNSTHGVSDVRKSPVLSDKPIGKNKPKLFPSVEDLRSVGRETFDTVQSPSPNQTASTSFSDRIPSNPLRTSSEPKEIQDILVKANDKSSNKSCESSSSTTSLPLDPTEKRKTKHSKPCDGDFYPVENMIVEESESVKKTQVKVESINKLKIRNSEWFCCADVMIEGDPVNVTFSDSVLEKLFSISASTVEVWRSEMSTNPTLKKRVNDILKTGQTKLKMLNCPMTLELSSDDCTAPHIVAIDTI